MRKPVNLATMSARRAYALGLLRSRRILKAMARSYDSELESLQHEFHEIAVSIHRERYDRALDEAMIERGAPDLLLH